MADDKVILGLKTEGDVTGATKVAQSLDQVMAKFAILGAAAAAPLAMMSKAAMDFSKDFAQVDVQVDKVDRTPAKLAEIRQGLFDLSTGMGTAIGDTTKAAFFALSSGVEAANLKGFLQDTSKAAVGGFADLKDVVNIATSSLDSYKASSLKVNDALDDMFAATKFGKMEFRDMAASLGPLLPISAQAGVSFKETVAAVAALTRVGFATGEAVTAMRSALVNVYKPTEKAKEVAEQYGIAFDVVSLKSKGMVKFIQDISTALAKSPTREQDMAALFGDVQGLAGMLALAGNNGQMMADAMKAVNNSTGLVDDAFNAVKENDISFPMRQLNESFNMLKINGGYLVAQVIGPLVSGLTSLSASLATTAQNGGGLATAVTAIVLGIAGLSAVAVGITATAKGFSVMGVAVKAVWTGIMWVLGALGGLQVSAFAVAAAIAAVLAGILLFPEQVKASLQNLGPLLDSANEWLRAKFSQFITWLGDQLSYWLYDYTGMFGDEMLAIAGKWLTGVGEATQGVLNWIFDIIVVVCDKLVAAWNWAGEAIKTGYDKINVWGEEFYVKVSELWNGLVLLIAGVWDVVSSIVQESMAWIFDTIVSFWNGAVNAVVTGWSTAATWLRDSFNSLGNLVRDVFSGIGSFIQRTWDTAKQSVLGFVEYMKRVVNDGIAAVMQSINNLWTFLSNLPGQLWEGVKALPGAAMDAVSPFAEGGYVSKPTLAMIGEGGEGEWVVPQSKLGSFMAAMGQGVAGASSGLTINVHSYKSDSLAVAQDVIKIIKREQRLGVR